jgi:chromatin modification-related protein EAF6
MTDNSASSATKTAAAAHNGVDGPASAAANGGGIPYYEKQRDHLKELIAKKRMLDKRLVS